MARKQLQRTGVRCLLAALVLTCVFGLGSATAVVLGPQATEVREHGHEVGAEEHEADEHEEHEEHEQHEEEDHVALTKQAADNLQLRMGSVSRGDYWKSVLVPGRVVEIPGQSSLSISASVTGIIEEVNVLPGQTLDQDAPLFTIRITDESLIDAQAKLLELLTRQEIAGQELQRLRPLVASGAVSGTKARDLEYETRQLEAQEAALVQELATRGMPKAAIGQLRKDRALSTLAAIYAPEFASGKAEKGAARDAGYSIESLHAHAGMSVARGDALCTVAYHPRLYVEGTAFHQDLPVLERIAEKGWHVKVEAHEQDESRGDLNLELLRIDNHVDEESQTVKFYLELPNEVSHTREINGRRFEQWLYRPGQRLHVRLPVERWENQITLPTSAVVVDGPNVFVFVEHHHEDEEGIPQPDSEQVAEQGDPREEEHEHDVFIELEPVPVRLLHRDDKTAVIADDRQLHTGEEVALNRAQMLYLTMKMQADGGGGHHHHHDH